MENFGGVSEISGQMQQEIFPFHKRMLFILAIASFIYSLVISSIWLYLENDVNIVWFLISVTYSSFLYVNAVRPIERLNQRGWLNTLFIIHIFIYTFGALLIFELKSPISIVLSLAASF